MTKAPWNKNRVLSDLQFLDGYTSDRVREFVSDIDTSKTTDGYIKKINEVIKNLIEEIKDDTLEQK